MAELERYLKDRAAMITAALEAYLPGAGEFPAEIHESMRYSVFSPGKRLRPILTTAAAEIAGADPRVVLPTACGVELIHTYSLIHDDLPCMDDDDLRRGRPTNHRVYGEAIATLAGDALLTLAFALVAKNASVPGVDPRAVLRAAEEIAGGAGTGGMIGGQVVDVLSEGRRVDPERLSYIHSHKTGALIRAAVRAGAIVGGATGAELDALTGFAGHFGLAFQITDDLLDVTGEQEVIGKPIGSDEKNAKATYPAVYGVEASARAAAAEAAAAREAVEALGGRAWMLRELAGFVVTRRR